MKHLPPMQVLSLSQMMIPIFAIIALLDHLTSGRAGGVNLRTAQSGLFIDHRKVVLLQTYSVDRGHGLLSPVA